MHNTHPLIMLPNDPPAAVWRFTPVVIYIKLQTYLKPESICLRHTTWTYSNLSLTLLRNLITAICQRMQYGHMAKTHMNAHYLICSTHRQVMVFFIETYYNGQTHTIHIYRYLLTHIHSGLPLFLGIASTEDSTSL